MLTGMIWFDNDPHKNVNEKIHAAIKYYQNKFGNQPTICSLNPKLEELLDNPVKDIEVFFNPNLSPDHIWLGVRNQVFNI